MAPSFIARDGILTRSASVADPIHPRRRVARAPSEQNWRQWSPWFTKCSVHPYGASPPPGERHSFKRRRFLVMDLKPLAAIAPTSAVLRSAVRAQEKLKIGVVAPLSGPPAVLGQQLRNGFALAVKTLGKLGGREVELVVADDELKPDVAVTKVK